jgi:hypothetical protein
VEVNIVLVVSRKRISRCVNCFYTLWQSEYAAIQPAVQAEYREIPGQDADED